MLEEISDPPKPCGGSETISAWSAITSMGFQQPIVIGGLVMFLSQRFESADQFRDEFTFRPRPNKSGDKISVCLSFGWPILMKLGTQKHDIKNIVTRLYFMELGIL